MVGTVTGVGLVRVGAGFGRLLAPGAAPVGVGSKASVQPSPASQISVHAWASRFVTTYAPLASRVPDVNPTATRAGIPSDRAITAKVVANCTQNPRRVSRNCTIAFSSSPRVTDGS